MATMEFKRGDTFILPRIIFWENKATNTRHSLTGVTIKCHIRDSTKALIAELTPTITDELNGEFSLEDSSGTTHWTIGNLSLDIEFTLATGQIISTKTITFTCIEDITYV